MTMISSIDFHSPHSKNSGAGEAMNVLDQLKYDEKGLVTAVARDVHTGRVVMLAHMNREALEKTLATRVAHYYSRSRRTLWKKGESSGHVQQVHHVYVDCD